MRLPVPLNPPLNIYSGKLGFCSLIDRKWIDVAPEEEVQITELQRIKCAAWEIITDPKANRIERIEALKLVAAAKGVLLPDVNEQWLSVRQVAQLRRIKQELVEKALARKERKKKANRKNYIRRKIKTLEAGQDNVRPEGDYGN